MLLDIDRVLTTQERISLAGLGGDDAPGGARS
jgi:hypothetical protein